MKPERIIITDVQKTGISVQMQGKIAGKIIRYGANRFSVTLTMISGYLINGIPDIDTTSYRA